MNCSQEFIEPTVSFSMRPDFREEYCKTNIRANVVMQFVTYVLDMCKVFSSEILPHNMCVSLHCGYM